MIITEPVDGYPGLVRRYSDAGFLIENDTTGERYAEAVDVDGVYTYTETAEPIEDEISDSEALDILLGREPHEEE